MDVERLEHDPVQPMHPTWARLSGSGMGEAAMVAARSVMTRASFILAMFKR